MKRRNFMLSSAAAGLVAYANPSDAGAQIKKRRLLYFTKSSGFEHDAVKRDGDRLSHSERIVSDLGSKYGFDVVCTKDGGQITAKNLANYDSVMFYTSGNLLEEGTDKHPAVSAQGMQELFDWVKAGGGFSAWHAGTDSMRRESADQPTTEYTKMVGGAFAGHHKQEPATVINVDPEFPAVKRMPLLFRFNEEWYIHDQINTLGTMHVLQILDTQSMEQETYRELGPIPMTWCSNYGKGRVFVSGIGHRFDVWEMPLIQGMVIDSLAWTFGDVEGDASPNYDKVMK